MLKGLQRGIEKESLRVRPDGMLADTPHPAALGSALTHPHITTDFSEAQLELITGVHDGIEPCLEELTEIHQLVYRHVNDEMLWCASMPCSLPADDDIPIGQYGRSNVGRAKTVYRYGLAHRYEKQIEAGERRIIGLNRYKSLEPLPRVALARTSQAKQRRQVKRLRAFKKKHAHNAPEALARLENVARERGNVFAELLDTVESCSLGQITACIASVVGKFRPMV
jgi:hypothetical protein